LGLQPALGQLAAEKLSQDARGYLRSTLLLQFQSHEPLSAAEAWKESSGAPGDAEQVAADAFTQTMVPALMHAPKPSE
jgi:hypothetical protein